MDIIVNVYKEKGMTSHDVVNKMRKIMQTKRVGHVGTLDPLAEGVLVVCVNSATKIAQFLESDIKEYKAKVVLGISTDTFDITGNITDQKCVENIDEELIDSVLNSFLGKQTQIPPIYSAIKVDGKKLYEYARRGLEVDIAERLIEIFSLERISHIEYKDEKAYFWIKAMVSKGTYIRSLCQDIGSKLDIPSTMVELLRVRSGSFDINTAYKLSDIEKGNYHSVTLLDALSSYPQIDLENDEKTYHQVVHGMKVSPHITQTILPIIVFKKGNQLLAVYEYADGEIKCYKAVRTWN